MSGVSKTAEEIFAKLVEIGDLELRERALFEACGEDLQLRQEVESLLDAHQQSGTFMGEVHIPAMGGGDGPSDPASQGESIGHYRLLELIGEGTFGEVWRAEQQKPVRRQVALKVIKFGMETREVVARFEAERQALALMEHPNIARVFDGGANDKGRPFFVMDLVRGIPVTDYCDRERLSITERLELFRQICEGVHHAHAKGIIHRDLKPSNILVAVHEGKALPTIIDFGIAKAIDQKLTDATLRTACQQLLGTPAYMSPEQAGMNTQDVDTRSDIYSLGAVLYELLTGQTPVPKGTLLETDVHEMCRLIRDAEPLRPSARLAELRGERLSSVAFLRRTEPEKLLKAVQGELDWIVLKALEKDRKRRYQSALAFALDLENHLLDEPVSAAAPTTAYRLAKTWRKNRGMLLTAASFILVLVGATIMSLDLSVKARQAERLATERLHDSLLVQARALTETRKAGQRFRAVETVRQAVKIKPSLEARNIALKALTLPDLKRISSSVIPEGLSAASFSPMLDAYPARREDGKVSVCDLKDHTVVGELRGDGIPPENFLFSPDGKYLALNYHTNWVSHRFVIWDWRGDRVVYSLTNVDAIGGICFSGDSKKVALVMHDHSIEIHDFEKGTLSARLAHSAPWTRVAFHPLNPNKLAAYDSDRQKLDIFDIAAGRKILSLEPSGPLASMAWSPSGERIVAGGYHREISIMDPRSGELIRTIFGHNAAVVQVAFTRNERFLVSLAWDGTLRFWDWELGEERLRVEGNAFALHRDGKTIGVLDSSTVNLYEIEYASEVAVLTSLPGAGGECRPQIHPILPLAMVYASGQLEFWDVAARRIVHCISIGGVGEAVFDPKGDKVIMIVSGKLVERPLSTRGVTNGVLQMRLGPAVALSERGGFQAFQLAPDGQTMAALQGNRILVIDRAQRETLADIDATAKSICICIDPRKRWVAAGAESDGVRVWEIATGLLIQHFPAVGTRRLTVFSPNGDTLLVGSQNEYIAYETQTWKEQARFAWRGVTGIAGAAFSPDDRSLALLRTHSAIALMDRLSGQDYALLEAPGECRMVQWSLSRSNSTLIAGTDRFQTQIWDLSQMRSRLRAMGLDWDPPAKVEMDQPAISSVELEVENAIAPPVARTALLFRDDFEGRFDDRWQIQHSFPQKVSLTDKPGHLTLWSQSGGFYRGSADYKNLFLLPIDQSNDFEATIAFSDLEPGGASQQAALLVFNDEDNYIKCSAHWNGRFGYVNVMKEERANPAPHGFFIRNNPAGSLWLRVTRIGNTCFLTTSEDGRKFTDCLAVPWSTTNATKLGFIAKNGARSSAPEFPVHVDSFELCAVKPLPQPPRADLPAISP